MGDKNGSNGSGGGNTDSPPRYRGKRWCLTFNNYTNEEYVSLKNGLDSRSTGYILGLEIGESGTKHVQGYVEFKGLIELSSLKKINKKIHWEKAKGNKEANIKYCSKEGIFETSFKIKIDKKIKILSMYEKIIWRKWQKKVLEICESKSEPRKIHWFWEDEGNTGKSFLARYIYNKYKCILAEGKKDNILNQTLMYQEKNDDEDPEIILVDIPRTIENKYVSYTVLEKLKDCLCYSGKYEGGVIQFIESPHIIVFSNEEPLWEKMSQDRWCVTRIGERSLF